MAILHPTESPRASFPMGDRLLVALLTAWSSRLHEAVDKAQRDMPNPKPVTRSRVWKQDPNPHGYLPILSALRPPPTELDDPDKWEWVVAESGHPELQKLEDLLTEFDEMIDMLSGVPRG